MSRTLQLSHSRLTEERVFIPLVWTCVSKDDSHCGCARGVRNGDTEPRRKVLKLLCWDVLKVRRTCCGKCEKRVWGTRERKKVRRVASEVSIMTAARGLRSSLWY
jgi:hypothetical protein